MEITDIHPLVVHFPIALLSVGYLFDGLSIVLKKRGLETAGWWNLFSGILASSFSVLSGFIADWNYGHFENPFPIFKSHGSLQIISILLFVVMFALRLKFKKKLPDTRWALVLYFMLGGLAVVFLFYGSHLGAVLAGRI